MAGEVSATAVGLTQANLANPHCRINIGLDIFDTAVQDDDRLKSNDNLAIPAGATPTILERFAWVSVTQMPTFSKQQVL